MVSAERSSILILLYEDHPLEIGWKLSADHISKEEVPRGHECEMLENSESVVYTVIMSSKSETCTTGFCGNVLD